MKIHWDDGDVTKGPHDWVEIPKEDLSPRILQMHTCQKPGCAAIEVVPVRELKFLMVETIVSPISEGVKNG